MTIETPTFYKVSAHAGSGKTYSSHLSIKRNPGKYTIATQTNGLSEQQKDDLAELGIKARVISLKNNKEKTCTEQYVRHCKDLRTSVAIVNQKVALQALYQTIADEQVSVTIDQHLIVDEFPSPVEKFVLNEGVSGTRAFLANLIVAEKCEYADYLEVIATDEMAAHAELGKQNSTLHDHVIQICKLSVSKHHRVFVSKTNYENFSSGLSDEEGMSPDDENSKQRLTLYAWLQPSILSGYKSVTFMGANFEYQKLFYYWRDKVNWLPHPEIKGERYDDFAHKAPLIEFQHMNEDGITSWNYLYKKVGYDGFKESLAETIEKEYPGQKYLVTLSAKDDGYWSSPNGTVLSPNPVGINAFQDHHIGVHIAPLNPSDMDNKIWEAVAGVSKAQLMVSQAIEMQYQAFTRTAVRDGKRYKEGEKPKPLVFVTLDLALANVLREIFGVDKPSRLLVVPALTEYVKPKRKTRSDKKTDEEKRANKNEWQRKKRAAAKAAALEIRA
ncbi:hypothetical protein [Shinella sp. M31]|uniref:hypothetical protein n=1 Tax=Shinella sp. M31 TaxID=3368615 RepID=UPI003B9DDAD7